MEGVEARKNENYHEMTSGIEFRALWAVDAKHRKVLHGRWTHSKGIKPYNFPNQAGTLRRHAMFLFTWNTAAALSEHSNIFDMAEHWATEVSRHCYLLPAFSK
jgi:hypothetical protein